MDAGSPAGIRRALHPKLNGPVRGTTAGQIDPRSRIRLEIAQTDGGRADRCGGPIAIYAVRGCTANVNAQVPASSGGSAVGVWRPPAETSIVPAAPLHVGDAFFVTITASFTASGKPATA